MKFYRLLRPLLFSLDAEKAHHLGLKAAKVGSSLASPLLSSIYRYKNPLLAQELFGLQFDNPLGIAAGFDKNASMIAFWDKMGVGALDIGSVTANSSKGNARPRAFRLPADEALINRMGLNNIGADAVREVLEKASRSTLRLGINITKTHDPNILGDAGLDDFCYSYQAVGEMGDFVTLNVSCPNTAEGKTFEDPDALNGLLTRIEALRSDSKRQVPLLVKLSPVDVQNAEEQARLDVLLSVLDQFKIDGLVFSNTSNSRAGLSTSSIDLDKIGRGGLSGKPLNKIALEMTRYVYAKTEGQVTLVGVGGIHDGESAWQRICAGASLLQLYTALVYSGPGLLKEINRYLADKLKANSMSSISDAVGSAV